MTSRLTLEHLLMLDIGDETHRFKFGRTNQSPNDGRTPSKVPCIQINKSLPSPAQILGSFHSKTSCFRDTRLSKSEMYQNNLQTDLEYLTVKSILSLLSTPPPPPPRPNFHQFHPASSRAFSRVRFLTQTDLEHLMAKSNLNDYSPTQILVCVALQPAVFAYKVVKNSDMHQIISE